MRTRSPLIGRRARPAERVIFSRHWSPSAYKSPTLPIVPTAYNVSLSPLLLPLNPSRSPKSLVKLHGPFPRCIGDHECERKKCEENALFLTHLLSFSLSFSLTDASRLLRVSRVIKFHQVHDVTPGKVEAHFARKRNRSDRFRASMWKTFNLIHTETRKSYTKQSFIMRIICL